MSKVSNEQDKADPAVCSCHAQVNLDPGLVAATYLDRSAINISEQARTSCIGCDV
jgi:hypothetical protein